MTQMAEAAVTEGLFAKVEIVFRQGKKDNFNFFLSVKFIIFFYYDEAHFPAINNYFFIFGSIRCDAQSQADSLLHFIRQNKSISSLFLKKNDTIMAHLNEDKLMPLASTVKIIIAIEFAKQASHHLVDKDKRIALAELDKYYIPHTDGNAHPNWINYEKQQQNINNDSVALVEVAKGMIQFSSNANAEYLIDLLGMNNINSNLKLLGLTRHTLIYPFVSALFLYQNPKHVKEQKIIRQIAQLSNGQYAKACLLIHNQLKNNADYKQKFRVEDLTIPMQKEWSDRLPASTTKEYVRIAGIINNRKIFDKTTYAILSELLETVMKNPSNQTWLTHAGMKGGSTLFVLTKAMYATLKDGTKIELAYFFNGLTQQQNQQLQSWMNNFELKILSDETFRKKVAERFN